MGMKERNRFNAAERIDEGEGLAIAKKKNHRRKTNSEVTMRTWQGTSFTEQ
jgi:hypothetical protein